MAQATEIKPGMVIIEDGELLLVIKRDHVTPGNWRGYVQVKARNLKTGSGFQKRYRSTDKVETAFLDKRPAEYLYPEGDNFVFMDSENYEQFPLDREIVGEVMNYVSLNSKVEITWYDGKPLSVDVPTSVVLEIVEADPPGAKGNTVTNVTKPAKLETGFEIRVPPHINVGDKVKVSTERGEFLERVN